MNRNSGSPLRRSEQDPAGHTARRAALCSFLLLAVVAGVARGDTIVVRPDGSGDQPTIQAAIDAAASGSEIVLTSGTFTGTGNHDLDFQGKSLLLHSAAESPDSCVIDCERLGRGFLFHSGEDSTAIVRGVSIRNGLTSLGAKGGAVACVDAAPLLEHCVLAGNESSGAGGAISCVNASPLLRRVLVTGNLALDGGGIYADSSSTPVIRHSTIASNRASANGGGIYSGTHGELTLGRAVLFGNCADGEGAEAYLAAAPGSVTFACCAVDSSGISGAGGATYDGNTFFADPFFCAPIDCASAPSTEGNYAVEVGSPCTAALSPCGETLGAGAEGCPVILGACCFSDGHCEVDPVDSCAPSGGVYQGDGTACEPNPCPQPPPFGACCLASGSCTILSAVDCGTAGGIYQGDNTGCAPNPCPQPTGACCFADGSCSLLTAGECATQSGSYQGNDTLCAPNPCPQPPTGACCFADGSCLIDTAANCAGNNGAYQGDNVSCAPNPCPQPTGACCFTDGSCQSLTASDCATQSGTYQGNGASCAPNPCPQPTGACCFAGATCSELTALDCQAQDGAYQGNGTDCSPNPCIVPTGACCFADGTCNVLEPATCGTQGGAYQGDESDCVPNPCPQPTGACCSLLGACTVVTDDACAAARGTYLGDNTSCAPNPCPPPAGACCRTEGLCTLLTSAACADSSGRYQGDGVYCDPNPCPAFHLLPDGSGDRSTIQQAIDDAVDGDVIELANGIYRGAGNKGLDFRGKAIRLRSESLDPDSCRIDCEGVGRGLYFKSGEDTSTVVLGLGILRGGLSGVQRGAGVACVGASPRIEKCRIAGNGGGAQGGGIYCEDASPWLIDCVITGNQSSFGGGLYAKYDSAPRLVGCTLSGNRATTQGGGFFSASNFTTTFERVILSANCADQSGDEAVLFYGTSDLDALCSLIDAAGVVGPGHLGTDGVAFRDPHFCGALDCAAAPSIGGDYHLRANSPAVPDSSVCAALIGALGANCAPLPRGACCLPTGGCAEVEQADCLSVGGGWQGDGTSCAGSGCAAGGACCLGDGRCLIVTASGCAVVSGDYLGDGSACSPYPCPPFVVRANGSGDFPTIQSALDALASGSVIELAAGTFRGANNTNLSFHGKAITLRAQTTSPESCVIDCQAAERGFLFENGEGPGSVVRGVTVASARATGAELGAGIRCVGASPTFIDCLIVDGRADGDGGGVYCLDASPSFTRCTIASNRAARGGGLFLDGSSAPTFERSIVANNCGSLAGGELYLADALSQVTLGCSDLDSTGVDGPGSVVLGSNVIFDDPLFCSPKSCAGGGPGFGSYRLAAASRCLAGGNPCGQQMGPLGQGCTTLSGACCIGGDCVVTLPGTCSAAGGSYRGNGTDCDPNPCPADGACCLSNQSCSFVTEAECTTLGGDYLGAGIVCPPTGCSYNAGGALLMHSPGSYHTGSEYCGASGITSCGQSIYTVAGGDTVVFHVLASFPNDAMPRLTGVTFGIDYDPDSFTLVDHGSCGDFELTESAWPDSGSGVAVTWNAPRTSRLVEVYWFAGYNRHPGTATRFTLTAHPVQGAYFADDQIPARLDPVVCFGALGLDGPGSTCCAATDAPPVAPLPREFSLLPVHPNPSSGSVEIRLDLPESANVELSIYAADGRRVRTLHSGELSAGSPTLRWDRRTDSGARASGGIYFVRFTAGSTRRMQKLLLLQ